MSTLAETHDALLLDLDGTVYLGGQPIDHVAPALKRASQQGARAVFVTNNASRPPDEVAGQLTGMGVVATAAEVLTSPQVAAQMLADRHEPGSRVLVVGAPWLADSVQDAGLRPVQLATDEPAAVVQGHSPDTGWRNLAEACIALRDGADWVACNVDSTLPTDRGLLARQRRDGRGAGRRHGPATARRRQAGTAAAGRGDSPHVVADAAGRR